MLFLLERRAAALRVFCAPVIWLGFLFFGRPARVCSFLRDPLRSGLCDLCVKSLSFLLAVDCQLLLSLLRTQNHETRKNRCCRSVQRIGRPSRAPAQALSPRPRGLFASAPPQPFRGQTPAALLDSLAGPQPAPYSDAGARVPPPPRNAQVVGQPENREAQPAVSPETAVGGQSRID